MHPSPCAQEFARVKGATSNGVELETIFLFISFSPSSYFAYYSTWAYILIASVFPAGENE